jgi:hypothetical protein
MRVAVQGDNPCAIALRSDLARMGTLVVTDFRPAFTIVVAEVEGLFMPVVDGVDSETERRIVYHLGERWGLGVHLKRAGGNRRDDELHVQVAPDDEMRHAVEVAVRIGLSEIAQGRKRSFWSVMG